MANRQLVQPETLRSVGFAAIGASYVVLGSAFSNPIRLLVITNATNGDLLLSLDGSTDHFFIAASSFKLFDFNTNRLLVDQMWVLPTGTQFYVKQSTAPSSGSVYLEALYG